MTKEYFTIDIQMLGDKDQTFSFHIYVLNPINDSYTLFLNANSPLTKEKYEFLNFIVNKGGSVSILNNQRKTFLYTMKIDQNLISDLQEPQEHELITLQRKRKEKREQAEKRQEKFHFKQALSLANESSNWMPIIEETKNEVMSLSFTISHTVSLANYLAENLLYEDNHTNRIVALSFQLAKGCSMDDPQALGDLVCAAFLSHIGQTQMDLDYCTSAQLNLDFKKKNQLKKHPGLAQHLIKKSGLLISERCNKILYQHHERYDGSGYPEYKQGAYIEPLALVLGASAHILEYMSGKITGTTVSLDVIINNIKTKNLTPGLELDFGDTIYESLIYLFQNTDNSKKTA